MAQTKLRKEQRVGGNVFLISDTLLTGNATTIDITDIQQTYKHLIIMYSLRTDRSATSDGLGMRLNNDSDSVYTWTLFTAYGNSTAGTQENSVAQWKAGTITAASSASGLFGIGNIFISDYTHASKKHGFCSVASWTNGLASNAIQLNNYAGLHNVAEAVTRITCFPYIGTNFVSGARLTLYGVN